MKSSWIRLSRLTTTSRISPLLVRSLWYISMLAKAVWITGRSAPSLRSIGGETESRWKSMSITCSSSPTSTPASHSASSVGGRGPSPSCAHGKAGWPASTCERVGREGARWVCGWRVRRHDCTRGTVTFRALSPGSVPQRPACARREGARREGAGTCAPGMARARFASMYSLTALMDVIVWPETWTTSSPGMYLASVLQPPGRMPPAVTFSGRPGTEMPSFAYAAQPPRSCGRSALSQPPSVVPGDFVSWSSGSTHDGSSVSYGATWFSAK
eukprot:7391912-Prymnesium_polylepis.2